MLRVINVYELDPTMLLTNVSLHSVQENDYIESYFDNGDDFAADSDDNMDAEATYWESLKQAWADETSVGLNIAHTLGILFSWVEPCLLLFLVLSFLERLM